LNCGAPSERLGARVRRSAAGAATDRNGGRDGVRHHRRLPGAETAC
jgi:hypothetical protein